MRTTVRGALSSKHDLRRLFSTLYGQQIKPFSLSSLTPAPALLPREREAACNTTDQIDEGNEVPLMLPSFPSRVSSSLSPSTMRLRITSVCVCVATTYACIDARACMCAHAGDHF